MKAKKKHVMSATYVQGALNVSYDGLQWHVIVRL